MVFIELGRSNRSVNIRHLHRFNFLGFTNFVFEKIDLTENVRRQIQMIFGNFQLSETIHKHLFGISVRSDDLFEIADGPSAGGVKYFGTF